MKIVIVGGGEDNFLLASHIGILYHKFEELLDAGKLIKVWSWYKNLVMHVKTYRDHSINWIAFDEAFALSGDIG